jgi:hypothetical protein
VQRSEDVLQEPNTLGCYANRLLTAMPMRGVHDGKTHIGHRRDNGQFHQPFLLKLALKPFRQGFAAPQGVDQLLIRNPVERVSCTPCVELVEKRYTLLLHCFQRPHVSLLFRS